MRKLILFFCLFILVFSVQGQKDPAFKALKKTYGKEALKVFKQAHGGLELLYYAYEHGIQIIQNAKMPNFLSIHINEKSESSFLMNVKFDKCEIIIKK